MPSRTKKPVSKLGALRRKAACDIESKARKGIQKRQALKNPTLLKSVSEQFVPKKPGSAKRITKGLSPKDVDSELFSSNQLLIGQLTPKAPAPKKSSSKKLISNNIESPASPQKRTAPAAMKVSHYADEFQASSQYFRELYQEIDAAKAAQDITTMRSKCLALLAEEYVPLPSRIEATHLLSTIVPKEEGIKYLRDGLEMLKKKIERDIDKDTLLIVKKLRAETEVLLEELDPEVEFMEDVENYATDEESENDCKDDFFDEESFG